MSAWSDLVERTRALLLHGRDEREMDEEVRFHIARETQERIRNGQEPGDARRDALLAFGGVERYKEHVRDARGTRLLEDLLADIRYAARGLRRNPGFTLTGILVLGIGIGATTTVYSIMHSVVLADLPYPEPDRLVRVVERNSHASVWALSTADVSAIRERQRVFSSWGEIQWATVAVSGSGSPEHIVVGRASAGYFSAIGVPVARGRPIEQRDETPDAPDVMVVTDALARRILGGTDAALGRSLLLDGIPHTVVGVLPPGRNELGGVRAAAFPALKLRPIVRRGPFWLRGVGRLKAGVSLDAAAADLGRISSEILPLYADFRDSTAKLTPQRLRDVIVGRSVKQVGLFAGAVALVLLLSIVNVATLVLVRASAREQELAVRVMLGAKRARVAWLLVTENLILTLTAGLVGLGLALAGLRLAVSQLQNLPRIQDASLDWRVIAVGVGAAVVSGILVSLSPIAALADRDNLMARAGSRRVGSGQRAAAVRAAFVTAEFALAWPLLVGAGLLLTSFVKLQQVNPGFDPDGVVAIALNLPSSRYPGVPELFTFRERALQRVLAVPGVTSVGLTSQAPPDNSGGTDNFNLVHRPVPDGQAEPNSPWYYVSAGYFGTLGIRVTEGRGFTPTDTADAFPVIIVSRSWAQHYLPGESAVGRQLVQGGCYNCPRTTIVGVVEDIRNLGLSQPMDAVYGPLTQSSARSIQIVARLASATPQSIASVRDALRGLDPELPLDASTLASDFDASLSDPMRWAAVLSAFAACGMGLAALGVFGLMAFSVRQRRREIGVRLALGALPREVTRLVVTRGMRYAATGSLIGLVVTLVVADRIQTMLFGIAAKDLATLAGVGALLLGTAFVASWIPGRRAARIKPMEAIGSE